MAIIVGPSDWWLRTAESVNALAVVCPVGTTLPDCSKIICKGGGTAWIVAPSCTQVAATWNGSTSGVVGNKPCVCDWATLNTQLINCGFNPSDWFVPSLTELQMGYACRSNWDTFSSSIYWSSTENSSAFACFVFFGNGNTNGYTKAATTCVRAFRRVTY